MRIRLVSDLHLEVLSEFSIEHTGERVARHPADVLVLAGDVCPLRSKRWKRFIAKVQDHFKHIIWIPGNHEYYGGNYNFARSIHRKRLDEYKEETGVDIHFLSNENLVIDNVNFICTTLWSDFEKRDPMSLWHCQQYINDFYRIKHGRRPMTPMDQYALHLQAKRWLFKEAKFGSERGNTNVVVTHHGPTWKSVHDKYKTGTWSLVNGVYVSELSEDILNSDIAIWCHGHTHHNFKYLVGQTLVVTNPKGYHEENFEFNPDFTLEVENG